MAMPQQPQETAPSPRLPAWLTAALAIAVGLLRVVPHPWNFTPIGAVGVFSGARLRSWYGLLLPLGVMVLTDVMLWTVLGAPYSPLHVSRLFVYPSFVLYAVLGRLLIQSDSLGRIVLASLLGSFQFFLITNFGTWLFGMDLQGLAYPKTLEGLLTCYAAALPFYDMGRPLGFFGANLLGDLACTMLLFGAYAVLTHLVADQQPRVLTEPEA